MTDNVFHLGGVVENAERRPEPPLKGEVVVPLTMTEEHQKLFLAASRFRAYCEAARKAQETMVIEDGIAAGRAWALFLDAFVLPPPGRPCA